jgi:hypothetical protein
MKLPDCGCGGAAAVRGTTSDPARDKLLLDTGKLIEKYSKELQAAPAPPRR